jgi:hypothetical protein
MVLARGVAWGVACHIATSEPAPPCLPVCSFISAELSAQLQGTAGITAADVVGGNCIHPACIKASLQRSLQRLHLATVGGGGRAGAGGGVMLFWGREPCLMGACKRKFMM